jgi:GAF domain-containing protein
MRQNIDRLNELRRLLVLDSQPEQRYDEIAQHLSTALGAPIVMVNLLDEDRDWFKARVGLSMCESPAQKSMCSIVFETKADVVLVPDTLLDARLCDHPFVVDGPKIRFYVAARLKSDGHTVGTLCAYDVQPKILTPEQIGILETLAIEVANLLVARKQVLPDLA